MQNTSSMALAMLASIHPSNEQQQRQADKDEHTAKLDWQLHTEHCSCVPATLTSAAFRFSMLTEVMTYSLCRVH